MNNQIFWLENFPEASIEENMKQKKEIEDAFNRIISNNYKPSKEDLEDWLDEFDKDELYTKID